MKLTEVKIRIIEVDLTDLYEGVVKFQINTNEYEAFFWGEKFVLGEERMVELDYLSYDFEIGWKNVFDLNKNKEKKLEKGTKPCEYFGYGQIESINPVVANFGDFRLNLGEWTNDTRVVGEYIYWPIESLRIALKLGNK